MMIVYGDLIEMFDKTKIGYKQLILTKMSSYDHKRFNWIVFDGFVYWTNMTTSCVQLNTTCPLSER